MCLVHQFVCMCAVMYIVKCKVHVVKCTLYTVQCRVEDAADVSVHQLDHS